MKCEGSDSRRAGCPHELAESEGGDFSVLFFHTKVSNRNTSNLQRRETKTLESLRLLLFRSLKENFKKQQNIPRG